MSSDEDAKCFSDIANDLIKLLKQRCAHCGPKFKEHGPNRTDRPERTDCPDSTDRSKPTKPPNYPKRSDTLNQNNQKQQQNKNSKLPLPKDIKEKTNDDCGQSFQFCKIITDPDDPACVAVVKETISQQSCKATDSANKDDVVYQYKYCKEVIKPFVKSFTQKCQSQEELLEYLRNVGAEGKSTKDSSNNLKPNCTPKPDCIPKPKCSKPCDPEPKKKPCYHKSSKSDIIAVRGCDHEKKYYFISDASKVCRRCPPPTTSPSEPNVRTDARPIKESQMGQAHAQVMCAIRCAAIDLAGKMAKKTQGALEVFSVASTKQLENVRKKSESCLSSEYDKAYENRNSAKGISNKVQSEDSDKDSTSDRCVDTVQEIVRKVGSAVSVVSEIVGESKMFRKISEILTRDTSSEYDEPERMPPKDISMIRRPSENWFDAIKNRVYSIFFKEAEDPDDTVTVESLYSIQVDSEED